MAVSRVGTTRYTGYTDVRADGSSAYLRGALHQASRISSSLPAYYHRGTALVFGREREPSVQEPQERLPHEAAAITASPDPVRVRHEATRRHGTRRGRKAQRSVLGCAFALLERGVVRQARMALRR